MSSRRRGTWAGRLALGMTLAGLLLAPTSASAVQSREAKTLHHRSRSFRIPFNIEEADRARLKEVQLYVSTDGGASWKKAGTSAPEETAFTYRVPRDGEYWIAVRTVDLKGRLFPPDDAAIQPGLKVVVDTTPPTILLTPLGRRGSRAGVRWDIRDEHLDAKTLTIEYQAEGARDWRQVPLKAYPLIGEEIWDAGTAGSVKVRSSVEDRAGNRQTAEVVLPDGLASNPSNSPSDERDFSAPPPISSASAAAEVRTPEGGEDGFVPADGQAEGTGAAEDVAQSKPTGRGGSLLIATTRFPLQYSVEDAGPEGPGLVELWTTKDNGRTWIRQPEDPDRSSPYNVELPGEGLYGLKLVVQSAAGLGDAPPGPGDRPDMWVEVDSTPPAVQLERPKIGIGRYAGKVQLTWRATDSHLGPRPVTLLYRPDRADATWIPIAGPLEASGKYVWSLPANAPTRFHIRAEAADKVGNKAAADTVETGAVLVDRTRPKGKIIGLDPSALGGPDGRQRR